MVDKAAIFNDITKRNAVRRAALLPLLDVRAEYDHAVDVATWSEACEKHADDLSRIHREVIVDLRRTHGEKFGYSVGAHWMINYEVSQRFRALLAAEGVYQPFPKHSITYGMDK